MPSTDLVARVTAAAGLTTVEQRNSIDNWVSGYLMPSMFQGMGGVSQTWTQDGQVQQIVQSLPSYSAALRASPPAFAAQLVRAMTMSQVRFQWRNTRASQTPGRTFGSRSLNRLERPWPRGRLSTMVGLMEWHAGLAGNSFVRQKDATTLQVIRPDYTAIIWGSQQEPEAAATALDAELIGYVYWNGGPGQGRKPTTIRPADMCHWAPLPDPETPGDGLGMSWVTAALRDIQGDAAASEHKLRFWNNAATPNMVVKGIPAANKEEFDEIVDMLEERHRGLANAYRTLYLTTGADATVVGNNFKDMDLKQVQGAGETRIALLGRVPATLLGISEGLQGSSLNAGNFGMSRRIFGDLFLHPQSVDLAGALELVTSTPTDRQGRPADDVELWPDFSDVPLLREDAKDAADIAAVQMTAIRTGVDGGFVPESVVDAVTSGDLTRLEHSGKLSVQLQAVDQGGDAEKAATAMRVAELIAKLVPGVDKIVSQEEARDVANMGGAKLTGDPPEKPAPPPALAGAAAAMANGQPPAPDGQQPAPDGQPGPPPKAPDGARYNPHHGKDGKFAPGGAGFGAGGGSAAAAAHDLEVKGVAAEPTLTATCEQLAQAHGGHLAGLDFKLKSEESLTRKIKSDMADGKGSADEVAGKIYDVNRYTAVFPGSEYGPSAQGAINDMRGAGTTVRVKNFWNVPVEQNPYQGINVQATTAAGQRFELQFHTQQSLDTKESLHVLYEKSRVSTSPAERQTLLAEGAAVARTVPVPPGAGSVS